MLDKKEKTKTEQATLSISITIDKRSAERMRLLRKLDQKMYTEMISTLNLKLLPILSENESNLKINKDTWKEARVCPKCVSGVLVKRFRRTDKKPFLSCYRYPACDHTSDI